jgi:hypothetical protein
MWSASGNGFLGCFEICYDGLTISTASDGIRTRDLSITNLYDCDVLLRFVKCLCDC